MEALENPATRPRLPLILAAAVLQGWALYALHLAIEGARWPATRPSWLLALYACSVLVPLTIQLLSEHLYRRTGWVVVAVTAVASFYFGWHYGGSVTQQSIARLIDSGEFFPFALVMLVLWLLTLPFLQWRLSAGNWRAAYAALFSAAWRNKLTLAEAALFTALFWLLLMLWQVLFQMLGIAFFRELFREPLFIYPVTSLVFGLALHLIGSVEKLTAVILEQMLNVLKWLALLAGLILTLFTAALLLKLPSLVFTGQRAIGAAWLLWLVAVMVLLVNAAYRDGAVERPYPKWIALALRCIVPLTIIVSLTALYALYVRIQNYGFTVERVWALIVAVTATVYSVGYAFAARSSAPWMKGIARVNIGVAIALIVAIALTLTPVLSPYRIAAGSQFRMALRAAPETERERQSPFAYLRFDAGRYGMNRLRALAQLQNHPQAEQIRNAAQAALARQSRGGPVTAVDATVMLDGLAVYPSAREVDADLRQRLETDLQTTALARQAVAGVSLAGVFVDLNEDDIDEFVLIAGNQAAAYEINEQQQWRRIGTMYERGDQSESVKQALDEGSVSTEARPWQDLIIGSHRFRLNE